MKFIILFIAIAILQISKTTAQTIATAVDAQTLSKLNGWNEWVKVSEDKAVYLLPIGGGNSCDNPSPTLKMQNDTVVVNGHVPYHTVCVPYHVAVQTFYIEMDIKQYPNYAKMPVIYKKNSIEFYEGMQQDLRQWENQVYYHYRRNQKTEYNEEKHRKAIENFVTHFKFEGTTLADLKALLINTEPQISKVGLCYNHHLNQISITWKLLEKNSGVRVEYSIVEPNIVKHVMLYTF